MIPSWVRAGAYCVCVDQEWYDDTGAEVEGPSYDDVNVVTGWHIDSGECCIRVLGWSTEFSFSASAFRPLSDEEMDMLYFNSLIRDSSVPSRSLERA